jgi:hypothetical protein
MVAMQSAILDGVGFDRRVPGRGRNVTRTVRAVLLEMK